MEGKNIFVFYVYESWSDFKKREFLNLKLFTFKRVSRPVYAVPKYLKRKQFSVMIQTQVKILKIKKKC